jgi:two-component system catabolic regulation response regulator CreB/two-component system response regulator ChvI
MTSGGYHHYHCDKSKRIFGLGSHDPKYYDQIITKLNLQAREQQHEHNSMQHLPQDQTARNSRNNRKKRVLLVDDEPDICMVYLIVLEDAGYECVSYTDPVKALQEFRPNYYDLILLDIKMPVINGFELCKKIIELDKTVHIIFITALEAYYEQFRSQHFPELGKINYIQKPIGNEELVHIVNMLIANSITVD